MCNSTWGRSGRVGFNFSYRSKRNDRLVPYIQLTAQKASCIRYRYTQNEFIGTDPNYTFIQCDITDKDAITNVIDSNKIDVVVHLANSVDNDIDPYVTDAEMKKSKICDKFIYAAANKAEVRSFILLSTTAIYGVQKGREPIRETAPEKEIQTMQILR